MTPPPLADPNTTGTAVPQPIADYSPTQEQCPFCVQGNCRRHDENTADDDSQRDDDGDASNNSKQPPTNAAPTEDADHSPPPAERALSQQMCPLCAHGNCERHDVKAAVEQAEEDRKHSPAVAAEDDEKKHGPRHPPLAAADRAMLFAYDDFSDVEVLKEGHFGKTFRARIDNGRTQVVCKISKAVRNSALPFTKDDWQEFTILVRIGFWPKCRFRLVVGN